MVINYPVAIICIDSYRANITTEHSLVRRPIPYTKITFLPWQAGKTAIKTHAINHRKGNRTVAGTRRLVRPFRYPDLIDARIVPGLV